MNFWTSDGTVDFYSFKNYVDTIVNEIHDIIYDLLKNKAYTISARKQLLDIDTFSNIYDEQGYKQEYKPFIYYGLRKYSVLTNFYLPEAQTSDHTSATSPFEAATNVILEIDELGFKNVTKNRGFELLVHLAAIDAAHKYLIEKTAHDINLVEQTELNRIIDELLKNDKSLFVKYKDIYIKYFQFLIQDRVELFEEVYKTDPEGFTKFLNFVYESEFLKEDVYFLRIGNKLYIANEKGIQKEVNDDFVKVDISLLPENVYIPSPYFYMYLNLKPELFMIFEKLLFTFINDNNRYPIVINAVTYNLTPQEMLQVFILTIYKSIIETLYGIKPVFRKINNYNATIINLYNTIKNSNETDDSNCFDVFKNCILTKSCSENKNSNVYFAGQFNRETAGLVQIIVNNSSDFLISIYNTATIDDAKNIAFYLIHLLNYFCEEDLNVDYLNKYSKQTIQQLATYLVDLPYRLYMYILLQKINLYRDHYLYFNESQILHDKLYIKEYYYNINQSCITDCYSNNSTTMQVNQDIRSINICNTNILSIRNIQSYTIANIQLCNTRLQNEYHLTNNNPKLNLTNSIQYNYKTLQNSITYEHKVYDYTIILNGYLHHCNFCM